MNYMTEIKLFYDWLETYPLSPASIALWHALMFIANRSGWPQEFCASAGLLALRTNLSHSTIYRERMRLRTAGRISFRPQGGEPTAFTRFIRWNVHLHPGSRPNVEHKSNLNSIQCPALRPTQGRGLIN